MKGQEGSVNVGCIWYQAEQRSKTEFRRLDIGLTFLEANLFYPSEVERKLKDESCLL